MTKILMILSGVDCWTQADGTKDPSGYWAEEFVVPHEVFIAAGFTVDLATTAGGRPTPDPMSLKPEVAGDAAGHLAEYIEQHQAEVEAARRLADVSLDGYDAIFIPGGHGPMEDLAHDPDLGRLLVEADTRGTIIAPLCHGPAALLAATLPGGRWQFSGRRLTVFTDEEEQLNKTAETAPWLVERVLKARGAVVESGAAWSAHVVVDGNLISGQNPGSSRDLAETVVRAIGNG